MKKIYLIWIFFIFSLYTFSQKIIKESIFEGTIGGKKAVLYIQTTNEGCTIYNNYNAILKYNETDHWFLLEVYANENNSFLFIETPTGGRYDKMIQVKQKGKTMTGYLYDTNHRKERVFLEKNTTFVNFESYREAYDEAHYLNYDC